jgi:hypothetical protein
MRRIVPGGRIVRDSSQKQAAAARMLFRRAFSPHRLGRRQCYFRPQIGSVEWSLQLQTRLTHGLG